MCVHVVICVVCLSGCGTWCVCLSLFVCGVCVHVEGGGGGVSRNWVWTKNQTRAEGSIIYMYVHAYVCSYLLGSYGLLSTRTV